MTELKRLIMQGLHIGLLALAIVVAIGEPVGAPKVIDTKAGRHVPPHCV